MHGSSIIRFDAFYTLCLLVPKAVFCCVVKRLKCAKRKIPLKKMFCTLTSCNGKFGKQKQKVKKNPDKTLNPDHFAKSKKNPESGQKP